MPFDKDLPRGPALVGVSWDGGAASKRRSYTPILLSVANTDSASSDTVKCIGYLPTIPSANADSDARRRLVQRCIGAIVKVINASAANGFMCVLHNKEGVTCVWHMYPTWVRSELDTKERYKFFGSKRQRGCGIGSGPRRGRSLFRPCTPHAERASEIERQRKLVVAGGPGADAAERSLSRRGLHPTIGCPAVLVDDSKLLVDPLFFLYLF